MKYIYENAKLMYMQDHHDQWWKVTQQCVKCGKCCADMKGIIWPKVENWVQKNGECKFLASKREDGTRPCLIYADQPRSCTRHNPHTIPEYCSVRFEKVDVPS